MEEKENKLFIPQGMKAEREYFQGFGHREMTRSVYAAVVLVVLAAIFYAVFHRTIYVVGLLIFGVAAIVAMVTRSEVTNTSSWDQIIYFIRYRTEQEMYYYEQMEED